MVEGRTHKPVIESDGCRTCKACVHGCPAEFIPEYRKETHSLRGALYSGQIPQLRKQEKSIRPPCQEACPVNVQTGLYTRLIAQGKYLEALDVIREELPFPGIIGRICHHPCEKACIRGEKLDDAVSLCQLKRFVADYEVGKREIPVPHPEDEKGKSVAVIGGGPSGMACALDLRKSGYAVTIFESTARLGGMLYWGVPAYRLPRQVLEREVSIVEKSGIEVRYETSIGKDISFNQIYDGYAAVYVACGAQKGAKLGLENENAPGVIGGVEFLKMANQHFDEALQAGTVGGQPRMNVGKQVLVVGGGNVAIDTARVAERLGERSVGIVCLEKRHEMAAGDWEIEQARQEGVKILPRWAPRRIIIRSGRVIALEVMRCVSVFDREGRFNPSYNEKITKTVEADTILVAIGQAPETQFLKALEGLATVHGGWLKSESGTLATSLPGVFAGGDIVAGPRMAIDAIADGKKAARSIDRYLTEDGERGTNGQRV